MMFEFILKLRQETRWFFGNVSRRVFETYTYRQTDPCVASPLGCVRCPPSQDNPSVHSPDAVRSPPLSTPALHSCSVDFPVDELHGPLACNSNSVLMIVCRNEQYDILCPKGAIDFVRRAGGRFPA